MAISALLNKWLNKLYKSIAVLLVLFAVTISAFRLFLPYAQNYKVELQNYINNTYQTDIQIGELSMDWQKVGPVLVAKNVSLIDTKSIALFIESLDIKVNFWLSLKERSIVTRGFTLDGAKIFVDKEALQNSGGAQNNDIYRRISDLFLKQVNKFSLTDSQLIVRTTRGDKVVAIDHLNWLNQGERHRASGNIIAEGVSKNTVKLLLDLEGEALEEMSGQFYVNAQQLDINPWLDKIIVLDEEQAHSAVNMDAWLTINLGKPVDFQVNVADSAIRWESESTSHEFMLNSASLFAQFNGEKVTLRSSPLSFVADGEEWQPVYFNADITPSSLEAYLSALDIGSIGSLLPLVVEDPEILAKLSQLAPSGKLNDIHIFQHTNNVSLAANIQNYQQSYSNGIPAITNVNGDVVIHNNQLVANLSAKDSGLDFDEQFIAPIAFKKLTARLAAKWDEQHTTIEINQATFDADALALDGQMSVSIPAKGKASMALFANIARADASQAGSFYPVKLMGDDLVNYLNRSVIDGKLSSGQVLFNGQLSDFPFHNNEGIFVVDADLEQAKFQFDQKWPTIEKLAANLNFTNNSMLITAKAGDLVGLNVEQVTAGISDLTDEKLLVINADINQQAPAHIRQLMNASPLKDSVGATLNKLTIGKHVSGKFSLDIPLVDTDNTIARGEIDFVDNTLDIDNPDMSFTQVNGRLNFENEIITTQNVKLNWRGMPVDVDVQTQNKEEYYLTDIKLNGEWQQAHWQQQLPAELKKYAAGNVDWDGNLALHMHKKGGFSYQASVETDLKAAQLFLPDPYEKAVDEALPLTATITGQMDKSTINVKAGNELSFYGVLDHQATQFQRAHLVLGNETMLLPMDGFHITAKLAQADVAEWDPFILDILSSLPQQSDNQLASHALFPAPERIRGNVDNVTLLGQSLSNVSFNLLDQKQWWLLRLNAVEARSEIKIFPNWQEQGIEIDADFIHLAAKKSSSSEQKVEETPFDYEHSLAMFNAIPQVKLVCASCKVANLALGKVTFNLGREDNKLVLKNFLAKRGKSHIRMKGDWQLTPDGSISSVTGDVKVSDLEREFDNLGFASIIKDSGMELDYNLHWNGDPQDFALEKLNGNLTFDIDDGYLADVSDKGARIFSVLSLQSLVRKLTLDFRDIFSDGMFYSYIRSDAQIKDGVLYTDNTRMQGAAGDLVMKGNTVLAEGLLDYRMSYKPNLTSSLPVLAWIATLNPVTFLAGVAIDEVFTSKVVSEFNFELTGNVLEPSFKEVDRKTRDVSVGRSTPPQFVENKTESKMPKPGEKNLTPPSLKLSDKNDG